MNPETDSTTVIKPHSTTLNSAIILFGIILVALCGLLLFQNLQLKQELNNLQSPPANQITSLPSPVISTSPPTDPTANWKMYKNTDLGFEFKYPEELSFNEKLEGPSVVSSGSKFTLSLVNAPSDFEIGAITTDFSAGRGAVFTDTQGYVKRDNRVYCIFINKTEFEISNSHIRKIYTNVNDIEIVLIDGFSESNNTTGELGCDNPGSGYIGALINLRGTIFKGLAIQLRKNSTLISEQQLVQILSTFRFVE